MNLGLTKYFKSIYASTLSWIISKLISVFDMKCAFQILTVSRLITSLLSPIFCRFLVEIVIHRHRRLCKRLQKNKYLNVVAHCLDIFQNQTYSSF